MTDAPAPTPSGQGDPAPTPNPAPAAPWYGQIEDADLKGWAENKNFKSPVEAMASYRNLEKVFGADKAGRTVVLPADNADPAEREAFFAKLGRPDAPDKYDLELPENHDKDLVAWFRSTAHKLGMPQSTAKEFLKEYQGLLGGLSEKEQTAYDNKLAEEHATLDREWGAAKPAKLEQAKAAARQFGFTSEEIDAIEKTVGYAGVMKKFADIGAKLGEGGLITPNNANNGFGALTPAAASAKIAELKADKDWVARWIGGDKAAIQQLDDLTKWANAK